MDVLGTLSVGSLQRVHADGATTRTTPNAERLSRTLEVRPSRSTLRQHLAKTDQHWSTPGRFGKYLADFGQHRADSGRNRASRANLAGRHMCMIKRHKSGTCEMGGTRAAHGRACPKIGVRLQLCSSLLKCCRCSAFVLVLIGRPRAPLGSHPGAAQATGAARNTPRKWPDGKDE